MENFDDTATIGEDNSKLMQAALRQGDAANGSGALAPVDGGLNLPLILGGAAVLGVIIYIARKK